jgi:hypothetical protein
MGDEWVDSAGFEGEGWGSRAGIGGGGGKWRGSIVAIIYARVTGVKCWAGNVWDGAGLLDDGGGIGAIWSGCVL